MKTRALLFSFLLLSSTAVLAVEQMTDFAFKAPVRTAGNAAFYRLTLSPEIYSHLVRTDLGDLRVFNAAGEVVPHAIESVRSTAAIANPSIVAPFFALPVEQANSTASNLVVRTGSDGTVISVASSAGKPQRIGASSYLIDASRIKQPVQALAIALGDPASQVSDQVSIDASDDLLQWHTVVSNVPVLNLQSGGQQLSRLRIEWPALRSKYLRLRFINTQSASPGIASLSLEIAASQKEAPRTWLTAATLSQQPDKQEFVFRLSGSAPVDQLRVRLPQTNTVAAVRILTRARDEDVWQELAHATVYRLMQSGVEIDNPAIAVRPQQQVMLRFDQRGGGIGSGSPRLEAGWIPQSLVFAARGNGPFWLGFGAARVLPAAYAIDKLVPGYSEHDGTGLDRIEVATLGPNEVAGNESLLHAQFDFKRWGLWACLIVGVLLLALMAYKLWRQMNSNAKS